MSRKLKTTGRRSTCPSACTLDLLEDKWSLLIIRDIGLFDKHRNKDFQEAEEGIPTNILADRLKRLTELGLLEKRLYQDRPPRYEYHLTEAGAPCCRCCVPWRIGERITWREPACLPTWVPWPE